MNILKYNPSINFIIDELSKKYENTGFLYVYNDVFDEHIIVHNSFELEDDDEFLTFAGTMFDKCFHDNGIFNVYLSFRDIDVTSFQETYEFIDDNTIKITPVKIFNVFIDDLKADTSKVNTNKLFNNIMYSKVESQLHKTEKSNSTTACNDSFAFAA